MASDNELSFPLMRLPLELRRKIYRSVFSDCAWVIDSRKRAGRKYGVKSMLGRLISCQQVSKDAIEEYSAIPTLTILGDMTRSVDVGMYPSEAWLSGVELLVLKMPMHTALTIKNMPKLKTVEMYNSNLSMVGTGRPIDEEVVLQVLRNYGPADCRFYLTSSSGETIFNIFDPSENFFKVTCHGKYIYSGRYSGRMDVMDFVGLGFLRGAYSGNADLQSEFVFDVRQKLLLSRGEPHPYMPLVGLPRSRARGSFKNWPGWRMQFPAAKPWSNSEEQYAQGGGHQSTRTGA